MVRILTKLEVEYAIKITDMLLGAERRKIFRDTIQDILSDKIDTSMLRILDDKRPEESA